MVGFNILAVASAAALTLFSGVEARALVDVEVMALAERSVAEEAHSLLKRWTGGNNPPCISYPAWKPMGCYYDSQSPRLLQIGSGLDYGTMTVAKCLSWCKGNGFQYAGLEYYGQCFCDMALPASPAAPSQCSYACTGDANGICGGNSYLSVYMDTTFPTVIAQGTSDYVAMGCYSDSTSQRTLPYLMDTPTGSAVSIESCLAACKKGGWPYAGVEFGQECYCGAQFPSFAVKQTPATCAMPCSGAPNEICGGANLINVWYAKDLYSNQPCTSYTSGQPPPPTTTPPPPPPPTTTPPPPPPPTTTPPPPPPPTTTKPTLCTTIIPAKCEFKIGGWSAPPLPTWTDKPSCDQACGQCKVQKDSCWGKAGWPDSGNCQKYGDWCNSVTNYCNTPSLWSFGKCLDTDCKSKFPPSMPPSDGSNKPTTIVGPCPPVQTPPPTPTVCPVPTYSPICTQPSSPWKGYDTNSPVGGIFMPCLQCNNDQKDYGLGNIFKLYLDPLTSLCKGYNKGGAPQACKDACLAQFNSCKATYAQSCQGKWQWGSQDSFSSATTKCTWQYTDCLAANGNVAPSKSRCGGYNAGWSDSTPGVNNIGFSILGWLTSWWHW